MDRLRHLLRDLETGEITTTEELRSRLDAIRIELDQEESSPVSPVSTTTLAPTYLQLSPAEEDISMGGDDMPTMVLPMHLVAFEDAGATDVGRQRDHNEDLFEIWHEIIKVETPSRRTLKVRGLYILCDGMGGHEGGEVASKIAVEHLKQYFQTNWHSGQLPNEASIREAVQVANQAIYDLNQKDARMGSSRMGTTLVMVLVQDMRIAVAHVGDSRLYRLRRRVDLEQVTVDHEVGQREIKRGVAPDIAYGRPDAYQLTQALGPRNDSFVHPDIQFLDLSEDTILILASDGLTDHNLLETHWQTHLKPLFNPQVNLEQSVIELIALANQHNGHDNITLLVIRALVRPYQER